MKYIIIGVIIVLVIRYCCDQYGKHVAKKIEARWAEQGRNQPQSNKGKPLPTPSDCREMIVQFFDIVKAVNERASYMSGHPHRLNMYGGGTDNMRLHIEYDRDFYGIDSIVRDQLGYDLPTSRPDGGGWYSDGRYLCFDSDNLTGGYEWQCRCNRNESVLAEDFKDLIRCYFPNMKFRNFTTSYLVDYFTFTAIGEG